MIAEPPVEEEIDGDDQQPEHGHGIEEAVVQKCCRNNDRRTPEPLQRSCLTAPDQLREAGENERTTNPDRLTRMNR